MVGRQRNHQFGTGGIAGLADAAHDTRDAAVSYAKSKVEDVAAGDLPVGADKTAKALEEDSKDEENAAKKKWDNAGDDLKDAKNAILGDDLSDNHADATHDSLEKPATKMSAACKIVRGKVPGPANHVLCATHGHVLDITAGTVIAKNLEQYKKRYGPGGPGYVGGGGYGGGQAPKQPDYGGGKGGRKVVIRRLNRLNTRAGKRKIMAAGGETPGQPGYGGGKRGKRRLSTTGTT